MRGTTELHGFYQFDDEGVKARPVTVVDKGILQTFLLGRAPLQRFPQSNGHGRAQAGYVPVSRQSNLMVEANKSVSADRLIEMLKEEARRQGKPFGLLFDNIEGGFTFTGRSTPNAFNVLPNVVYRVYADGRPMELVRGVDLIGTPLAAFAQDPRRQRRRRRLQRLVRRRERQRPGVGVVAVAARERGRSPEEGAVPGNAADPAGARAEASIMRKRCLLACAAVALILGRSPLAQDSPLVSALKDELARSMSGLRIKDEPPPYYIEYHVDETVTMRTAARLGAVEVNEPGSRLRTLSVEVRVGDYQFDSSRFVTQGRGGFAPQAEGSAVATLDDNYDAIRRQLWLATDAAYKRAISTFARKKAAFQNRATTDPLPDFSREDAGHDDPPDSRSGRPRDRLGAARPRAVGRADRQPAPPVVRGVDCRAVRHALLPEQRRLHGRDCRSRTRRSWSARTHRPTTA